MRAQRLAERGEEPNQLLLRLCTQAVLQAAADSACAGGDGHDAEHIQARVRDLDATLEPRVFVFRLSDGNAL